MEKEYLDNEKKMYKNMMSGLLKESSEKVEPPIKEILRRSVTQILGSGDSKPSRVTVDGGVTIEEINSEEDLQHIEQDIKYKLDLNLDSSKQNDESAQIGKTNGANKPTHRNGIFDCDEVHPLAKNLKPEFVGIALKELERMEKAAIGKEVLFPPNLSVEEIAFLGSLAPDYHCQLTFQCKGVTRFPKVVRVNLGQIDRL